MTAFYLLMFACMVLLGGSAVAAFCWAGLGGQFAGMRDGAASIFDGDEPVGRATDAFPKNSNKESRRQMAEVESR